jgi:hypothetical protein
MSSQACRSLNSNSFFSRCTSARLGTSSTSFLNHRLHCVLVQCQIGYQALQPGILLPQLPDLLCLAHVHAAILGFPGIHRILRHSVLPTHFCCVSVSSTYFRAPMIWPLCDWSCSLRPFLRLESYFDSDGESVSRHNYVNPAKDCSTLRIPSSCN